VIDVADENDTQTRRGARNADCGMRLWTDRGGHWMGGAGAPEVT